MRVLSWQGPARLALLAGWQSHRDSALTDGAWVHSSAYLPRYVVWIDSATKPDHNNILAALNSIFSLTHQHARAFVMRRSGVRVSAAAPMT